MTLRIVNPPELRVPHGYVHGVAVEPDRRMLLAAGQTAADRDGRIRGVNDLVLQFDLALGNVLALLAHAGAAPDDIARMRIYVTDVATYRAELPALGVVWRRRFGTYYPAITFVGVAALFEPDALIEIEVEATIPGLPVPAECVAVVKIECPPSVAGSQTETAQSSNSQSSSP